MASPILLTAHQLKKAFGARPLFEGLNFTLEAGERVGLIGPNGAGKSTLLSILAGRDTPDAGTLSFQKGLRVGFLEQVPAFKATSTVREAILAGAREPDEWQSIALAEELVSKFSLAREMNTPVSRLSGGWKKRVALARERMRQPDLLLLDEPTNHLDVESIQWLEAMIEDAAFATLTITHDRAFLQRVASRVLELDPRNPGGLLSVRGGYEEYLKAKDELLSAQNRQEWRLKNTFRRETEWLRRGAKARTTKQQARIQRAGDLESEIRELETRNRSRIAAIDFQNAEKNPKKLLEARDIAKSYGDRRIFGALNLTLTPGTRLGILGPNGCGKSTLIRVLLGQEPADGGTVKRSEHLSVAYFEQNRESLDPERTLAKTLCPVGEYVDFRGNRVHIRSYLDRFLFSPTQAEMPVGRLSGGEQARVLIARLMLAPANLLVLDEPTNDLDLATLELLEEVLRDYTGAVILVSHDRFFTDQVSTRILAFSPTEAGKVVAFADLDQWERWHELELQLEHEEVRPERPAPASASASASNDKSLDAKKKLSFRESRELERMEGSILEAEAKLAAITQEIQNSSPPPTARRMNELAREMSEAQARIEALYARWNELTERATTG